jgi:hypothetical protein
MKKVDWVVVVAGLAVGIAAVVLTLMGNPSNMGFCIASCVTLPVPPGFTALPRCSMSGRRSLAWCWAHF